MPAKHQAEAIESLSDALLKGQRRALAQSITLIESSLAEDRIASQQLLERLLPHAGNSIRVGISGVPGVGKSTFIEALGLYLADQGKRVAVLAVDPSSPVAGGSILGDKTRMESLSRHPNAFIRPSPTSGALGGVAQRTRETILLCEAAAYDVVLVETVGVGQSEYDVASMVDFFLLLMMPNAGDELQGIKKGIVELVHALVINKADGESVLLAEQSREHYKNALHLLRADPLWTPVVTQCSALHKQGIAEVWALVEEYMSRLREKGELEKLRNRQNLTWMRRLVHEVLERKLREDQSLASLREKLEREVSEGKTTAYAAAITLAAQLQASKH
ncbi:MAG: methylmalonyl Co-A mutase-associated GTPase MeaB [Pseudomonadales bacterium]|nr:MAG: methylmalonyl Co-A mutase-associated GTPase MeaB [Pseudomonadales bacterium]